MARGSRSVTRRAVADPLAATGAVRVVHALPRRVRLKIGGLKGDSSFARELEQALRGIRGVRRVDANPATGSVLVLYDDSMRWQDSIPAVARGLVAVAPHLDEKTVARHLTATSEPPSGGPLLEASDVRGFFGGVNETVRTTTGGLDLKLLVPLALVLLGVRGFFSAEKGVTLRWYDLLWFGFGTFMMLNAAGVPPARAVEEAAEVAAAL
jgi:hypothetical protein